MMVLKKYENKVGKKTTSPDLNSFLKITALLEKKKKWLSPENTSSNGQVLSHIKMKHFSNNATGLPG